MTSKTPPLPLISWVDDPNSTIQFGRQTGGSRAGSFTARNIRSRYPLVPPYATQTSYSASAPSPCPRLEKGARVAGEWRCTRSGGAAGELGIRTVSSAPFSRIFGIRHFGFRIVGFRICRSQPSQPSQLDSPGNGPRPWRSMTRPVGGAVDNPGSRDGKLRIQKDCDTKSDLRSARWCDGAMELKTKNSKFKILL